MVLAAHAVLAEGGVEHLTMAAVAARLDVTPMALYRHVNSRASLLDAVAESALEHVGAGIDPEVPWAEAVVVWMRSLRTHIVENPWAAQLVGTTTQVAPAWAAALDRLLICLERGPMDDAARAGALLRIARTTMGVVLLEAKAPLLRPGRPITATLETALRSAPVEMAGRWERIHHHLPSYGDDDLFEDLVRQTTAWLIKEDRFMKHQSSTKSAPADTFQDAPSSLHDLTDAQWQRVRAVLPAEDPRGAPHADVRRVIDGIIYRDRFGVSWRNVPSRYGSWQTIRRRRRLWTEDGTWGRVTAALDNLR